MTPAAAVGATLTILALVTACGAPAGEHRDGADADSAALPGASADGSDGSGVPGGAAAGARTCLPVGALVTGDGVGEVQVGRTVAELRDDCRARDTTFTLGEGATEEGLSVRAPGAPVVAMHTGGDRVTRVIVSAPGPATAAAVGVGSTVGEVRLAYPRACVLVGEGRLVIAVAEVPGLSLGTTADYGSLVTGGRGPSLAALPDTARVSSLWAVGATNGVCR